MASESAAPGLIAFADRAAAAARLADLLEAQLGRAIAERGAARFAISGGSTPAALYRDLSERDLPWEKVTAVLVDERWVPPGAEGSNETFARETLAQGRAADVRLVGLRSDAPTPADGLSAAEARIGAGSFDVVVLGLGPDGHTASWFPHAEGLAGALSKNGPRVAAVRAIPSDVTGTHVDRITLTLGAIADAGLIAMLIAGDEKRAAFERVAAPGSVADAPARAVLAARDDMWVCWSP
ncbi:MAG: 6-phosphogluconolactonase [Pseudomonadota bacterium]